MKKSELQQLAAEQASTILRQQLQIKTLERIITTERRDRCEQEARRRNAVRRSRCGAAA